MGQTDRLPVSATRRSACRICPVLPLRKVVRSSWGVRPEYLKVVSGDVPGRVPVSLDLIETLGSEALLHATLQGEPFVMKAETQVGLSHLDAVDGFTIEPVLIKVFDKETGAAIGAAP